MARGCARRSAWAILLIAGLIAGATASPGWPRSAASPAGPAFQSLLELEQTARLLAVLLDSGRAVVNEHPELYQGGERPGLAPDLFEQQLNDMFRARSGIDLRELDESRAPEKVKRWLPLMVTISKEVVAESDMKAAAQALSAAPSSGDPARPPLALIPAVFGSRVATRFSAATGVRLKQTSLTPRNPANAPDAFEQAALQAFADPGHAREQAISEVTAQSGALRLMYPLYATRQCLACHGEPKGQPDTMGYRREGLRIGQNAGAISVVIPLSK
ncbi:Tll0287-like domain-containing protein [Candidatus Nitrospira bockiana]